MKPKKDLIKAAEADGSIDRLNSLLSAAHILNCEANMLVEEAADLMNAKGLLLGNVKRLHNNFVKSADLYFLEFSSLAELGVEVVHVPEHIHLRFLCLYE